ncbi:MAG: radical SAM protein [Lachnospiraceae bacterium]|nr:radical SAM protein [Lachnospiraceae bacterium]
MGYVLSQCVWEITLACCFSCKYCGSSANGMKRENELSTEECLDVAAQLKEMGCRRVSLIGGEVFMRTDWPEIVESLTGRGISVCIITNGFLFRPEHIDALKRVGIESVAISLDGPEEVHDKYRQKGSYERAVNAVKTLHAGGIPVSLISTLNHENAACLESFLETVKGLGIFAWQLQACSPMGNAAKAGIDYAFDAKEVIAFVERHMNSVPFSLGIAHNIGYHTKNERILRGDPSGKAYFTGCTAGLTTLGIDSIGNVRGCESMYDDCFIEGNVRERPLADIWNDENAFAYNRKYKPAMLTGKCAVCEKKGICAAGCRSYNHFVHGKLYEAPACARD